MTDTMQMIRDGLKSSEAFAETVREALPNGHDCDCRVCVSRRIAEEDIRVALTALDSLVVAPSEDAYDFALEVYSNYGHGNNNAATLIQTRDERIRRECADRNCKTCGLCDNDSWEEKSNFCISRKSILTPEVANER